MQAIQSIDVIAIDPTVRNGRPFIVGTTIEVSAIVIATIVHGQTPEEIASDYKLTLTQVHAALAYYYDHKIEVDTSIEQRRELANQLKEQMIGSQHPPLHRRKSES
jgi:uncharacterized protein (DUF433 family)